MPAITGKAEKSQEEILGDTLKIAKEYFLGTYAPLKWYAWKFFDRHGLQELAALYKSVFENWKKAFDI